MCCGASLGQQDDGLILLRLTNGEVILSYNMRMRMSGQCLDNVGKKVTIRHVDEDKNRNSVVSQLISHEKRQITRFDFDCAAWQGKLSLLEKSFPVPD